MAPRLRASASVSRSASRTWGGVWATPLGGLSRRPWPTRAATTSPIRGLPYSALLRLPRCSPGDRRSKVLSLSSARLPLRLLRLPEPVRAQGRRSGNTAGELLSSRSWGRVELSRDRIKRHSRPPDSIVRGVETARDRLCRSRRDVGADEERAKDQERELDQGRAQVEPDHKGATRPGNDDADYPEGRDEADRACGVHA